MSNSDTATVSWLARDPERVRKARPFYAPFSNVMAASDAKLQKQLIDTYGDALGAFVAASVEISERNLPAHDAAVVMFGLELDRVFPTLEASQRRVAAAFVALSSLARRSIGAPLARAILCQTIEGAIGLPRSSGPVSGVKTSQQWVNKPTDSACKISGILAQQDRKRWQAAASAVRTVGAISGRCSSLRPDEPKCLSSS